MIINPMNRTGMYNAPISNGPGSGTGVQQPTQPMMAPGGAPHPMFQAAQPGMGPFPQHPSGFGMQNPNQQQLVRQYAMAQQLRGNR